MKQMKKNKIKIKRMITDLTKKAKFKDSKINLQRKTRVCDLQIRIQFPMNRLM